MNQLENTLKQLICGKCEICEQYPCNIEEKLERITEELLELKNHCETIQEYDNPNKKEPSIQYFKPNDMRPMDIKERLVLDVIGNNVNGATLVEIKDITTLSIGTLYKVLKKLMNEGKIIRNKKHKKEHMIGKRKYVYKKVKK